MRLLLASMILSVPLGITAAIAAPPPADGHKLSQIIAKIEQAGDLDYIDEVDWNNRGYYEIEYLTKAGAKVEVKIDPKTGEIIR